MSYPLLVAMLLAPPVQRSDSQAPPRTIPELESRVRIVLERTHTPGISIAVVSRDRVLWQTGIGLADVASGREATPATLFRIGSASKTFTALMVLLLEQEGRLHLEDPIRHYIPEIAFTNAWESTDPVRIVNVLEHTAGWDDWSLRVFANSDPTPLTLRQGLDLDSQGRTSRWRPGTRVSYTNWGPPVAAYIVEKVTNRPFEELVHDRLFVPIGMTTATFRQPGPGVPTATLYHRDGTTPFPYWHLAGRPTGAINASATDMAAYVRFLLNRGAVNGRQLLPAAAMVRLELPTSSLTARAGLSVGYGLFLATYIGGGLVWVGHGGEVPGGLASVAYRPVAGVGYAFMINSSNGAAAREIEALIRGYLTGGAPRPVTPTTSMSSLARAHRGWYVADNPRMQRFYFFERMLGVVRVRMDDSTLTVDPVVGDAKRYVPVSETLFRGLDEPVATLAMVDDAADARPASLEVTSFGAPLSFRRISPAAACLTLGVGGAFCLTTLASLLVGLAWILVAVLRRGQHSDRVWLSVWPFVSAVSVVACFLIVKTSREDALARFGAATAWSISLFACITLFAVASVVGLVMVARSPRSALRGPVRVHALVSGVVNIIVVGYLAWWGVLGWRIWA